MPRYKKIVDPSAPVVEVVPVKAAKKPRAPKATSPSVEAQTLGISELAQALTTAINAAKPPEKKNAFNRRAVTPWTPKDGSPKLKLRRKMHQHGVVLDQDMLTNEEIELLNRLKPGRYMDQHVKVTRRRDRGIDIDYPIKTAAQRLKLVNAFGIRTLTELLSRCVEEAAIAKDRNEQLEDYD